MEVKTPSQMGRTTLRRLGLYWVEVTIVVCLVILVALLVLLKMSPRAELQQVATGLRCWP